MTMTPSAGLLGTFDEPGKVITACNGVSIFIIDAYKLRSNLSRLRVTLNPEPGGDVTRTNVYSIRRTLGFVQSFKLVYNCHHDHNINVSNCTACDNGTVLLSVPPIDRLMFDEVVLDAMTWLSEQLTSIGAQGFVQVADGTVREISWWNKHHEQKTRPEEQTFLSPFHGADRTPIPWSIYMSTFSTRRTRPGRSDVPMVRTAYSETTTQGLPQPATRPSAARPPPPNAQTVTPERPKRVYWDPVYDSHNQNVEEEAPIPDFVPLIPLFPFRGF